MSSKKATRVARAYIDWQVAKRGAVVSLRQKENLFNPDTFLSTIGMGRKLRFSSKHTIGSASAITDCELLRIDKEAMRQALHQKHALSDMFVAHLLARNIRCEEDLTDQLFNSSEKRLARILLLLAHVAMEGSADRVIPEISQTTLAEMVGTTRSRINFFMNRFRKLGFIHYDAGGLEVRGSLLNVILHD